MFCNTATKMSYNINTSGNSNRLRKRVIHSMDITKNRDDPSKGRHVRKWTRDAIDCVLSCLQKDTRKKEFTQKTTQKFFKSVHLKKNMTVDSGSENWSDAPDVSNSESDYDDDSMNDFIVQPNDPNYITISDSSDSDSSDSNSSDSDSSDSESESDSDDY